MVTIIVFFFLKEDISLVHLTLAVSHNGQAHYQMVEEPPVQLGALNLKRVFLTKIYVTVSTGLGNPYFRVIFLRWHFPSA